ncbi:hypothetical protein [Chamaesiphon sp.]|uniref:hypothetical protein n=1 Tax=Chamaesiphon sp. TaxID=2814140 RepID=UPI0035944CCB
MNDKYPIAEVKTARIVCLDAPLPSAQERLHRDRLYLFAEIIDTIEISDRYWVRPLALARSNPESFQLEFLHDLRDAAQLILPIGLFRDALDTEVLPLISELFQPNKDSTRSANAQKVLYQFIADLYRSLSI